MKVGYKDMLLYAVTDNRWLGERSLVSQVEDVLKNGATFLQLRHKDATHEELVREAMLIKPVAAKYNVPFVVEYLFVNELKLPLHQKYFLIKLFSSFILIVCADAHIFIMASSSIYM